MNQVHRDFLFELQELINLYGAEFSLEWDDDYSYRSDRLIVIDFKDGSCIEVGSKWIDSNEITKLLGALK